MGMQAIVAHNRNGEPELIQFETKARAIHPLTRKREKFARLIALGESHVEAYMEAYEKPSSYDKKLAGHNASVLLADTDVVLRVEELKKPILRKLHRKMEYNLNRALEQCEEMYDLARAQGDTRSLGKAIELQSKLTKLLTEQVDINHRYGILDDATTEVLLAMRKEIEVRRVKMKVIEAQGREIVEKESGAPPTGPFSG